MHYIQKHILDLLRAHTSMHYADLNPKGIESGHFRYHLNQLVQDAYVMQHTRGVYGLTPTGLHYVDTLSERRIRPEQMPKVISYTLLYKRDTLYLHRKAKEPYKDLLNMIGGKIHEGELAREAAVREVSEKTGLDIPPPQPAITAEIIIRQQTQILSHAIACVFTLELQISDPLHHNLTEVDRSEVGQLSDLAPDFSLIYAASLTGKSKHPYHTLIIDLV